MSTVKPLTEDLLALPSVSAAIEAAVAADRAIWVEKVLTRRAYAVLRRKGLSEHEARSRLSYSKSLVITLARAEMLYQSVEIIARHA